MLYEAVFAEHPWNILVHLKKVSAYMGTRPLLQELTLNPSTSFITTQTPESCPKHRALHGMGLPATADLDSAKVKAEKIQRTELAVSGN